MVFAIECLERQEKPEWKRSYSPEQGNHEMRPDPRQRARSAPEIERSDASAEGARTAGLNALRAGNEWPNGYSGSVAQKWRVRIAWQRPLF